MARTWGAWTEIKLEALSDYLHRFTTASNIKTNGRMLYLDLFAGGPANVAREDEGRKIFGSADRALSTTPPFAKSVFFELQPKTALELERHLKEKYPGRKLHVVPDDCNKTLPNELAELRRQGWDRAPTFAFLDQYAAEIRWETIEALARFRTGKWKTELWMYLGDSFIPRGAFADDDGQVRWTGFAERVDAMFGTAAWREMHRGRIAGMLSASEFRAELVNLMRWRLENELGYSTTLPLQFKSGRGIPLYTMIFATDHDAGARIMRSIFERVQRSLDQYQAIANARRQDERAALDGIGDALLTREDVVANMEPTTAVAPTFAPPTAPWTPPDVVVEDPDY